MSPVKNKTGLGAFQAKRAICRVYVDLPFCFGIYPTAEYLTAGKDNLVGRSSSMAARSVHVKNRAVDWTAT